MITYKTKSGSIYDVEGLMVRRRVRSEASKSERVSGEWKEAQKISYAGLGQPLVIVWGTGRDEYSYAADFIGEGEDEFRIRHTVTTPVVSVVENDREGKN